MYPRLVIISFLAAISTVAVAAPGQQSPASVALSEAAATANATANALDKRAAVAHWTIVNKGVAIRMAHNQNSGSPEAKHVSGGGMGHLTSGGTVKFTTEAGWAGRVAIGKASDPVSGSMSLIEGSFMNGPRLDVDVSYVDGFTVPITCKCIASNRVLSGCSLNLWARNKCPSKSQGACLNPLREDNRDGLTATPFFRPCQGAAYTFPRDSGANTMGECPSNRVTCCVGTVAQGCPANPKQG